MSGSGLNDFSIETSFSIGMVLTIPTIQSVSLLYITLTICQEKSVPWSIKPGMDRVVFDH